MKKLLKISWGSSSVRRDFGMSHFSPFRYICLLTLLIQIALLSPTNAQEYLSKCDNSELCAKDKFFRCVSNQCQCEDSLNQVYDSAKGSCVIMAGRKCAGILTSAELMDPRKLESVKTIPTCGSNAQCDPETSSCVCEKGYFHNESIGECELSFGRGCGNVDNIIFDISEFSNGKNESSGVNSSELSSSATPCDKSVGLYCGSEGFCKCRSNSVWKIDQGCVLLKGSGSVNDQSNVFQNFENNAGNYFNLNPDYSNGNYGVDEQAPLQQFLDSYTKALLDANNYYYFNPNNANLMGTGYNTTLTDISPGGATNNSENKSTQNLVGDRNQFPGGIGINGNNNNGINQNDQLWNFLLQQELEKNVLNNVRNNQSVNNDDIIKLQLQAIQLQKLLAQQQELQKLVDQLIGPTTSTQTHTQPNENFANFPTPSPLVAPSNNLLGLGVQNQAPINTNSYPSLWNQPYQQQQQQPLFGGPFPFFRLFRNFIDPIKRALFPNLMDAAYTFPSPLYLVASTVRNFLPVLRAFDQQFSPMLENIVQLTKPRPRPTNPPIVYNNNNNNHVLQQLQQWSNNNRLLSPNNQQHYQGAPNGQRPFLGNGLLGLGGIGSGRSLNFGTSSQRRVRTWNHSNRNNVNNLSSLARRLWWG